jgi:hypothetical protein
MMADLVSIGRSSASHQRTARAELGIPFSALPDVFTRLVVQTNTFVLGNLVSSRQSTDWILASNDVRESQATGMILKAQSDRFWYASIFGMPIELDSHGLVLADAPANVAWLALAGAMTMTKPVAPAKVLQRVARPLTANFLMLMIEHPQIV